MGNLVDDISFRAFYPLYYDANGGTGTLPKAVASGTFPNYYEQTGTPITLASNGTSTCNIVRNGYTFMGWSSQKYPAAETPEELAKMTRGYQYTMKASGTGNRVYAVWVKSPSITFKTEYGQTVKAKTTYAYGTKVSAPTAPTLDHQRFDGWKVESGDTGYSTTGLTRDTVVVAQYTPLYDVRFFNGVTGTQIGATQIIPEHDNATVPSVPTNTGYTFIKWDRPATNIIRNTDVTAQYRAHRYQVHYNENGDNVRGMTPNSNHVYDQTKELTINGFTRPGYDFMGWSLSPNGSKQFSDAQSVLNLTSEDDDVIEMYAVWKEKDPIPIQYMVEIPKEGAVTRKAELVRPATGDPFGSVSIEYSGYTFDHWRDGTTWDTTTDDSKWVPVRNNDLIHYPNTYIAYFHPHEYTVSYHQNATNVYNNMDDSQHVYDEGKELNANKFVHPGYRFLGWSRDQASTSAEFSDCEEVINLTDQDGAIVDLYAIWVPDDGVHVTYKTESVKKGRVTTSDEHLLEDQSESSGSNAVAAKGYHFVKWLKDDGTEKLTEHVNADKNMEGLFYTQSYTACFDINKYVICYDKNSDLADGYMQEQSFLFDEQKGLSENGYSLPGSKLLGWSTSPDGDVEFLDGQMISELCEHDGDEVTLYAVWQSADITIEYASESARKGSVSVMIEEVNPMFGTPVGSSAVPAKGYKVLNWTDASGAVVSTSADMMPQRNATNGEYEHAVYTAHFVPISYAISFDGNAPDVMGTTERMENLPYDTPTQLRESGYHRAGYVFLGWSLDPRASSSSFADRQMVSNLTEEDGSEITLYAIWAEEDDVVIEYRVSDEAGGKVSVAKEAVAPASGSPSGSVASANVGWEFKGWTTLEGDPVGEDELLIPSKSGAVHESAVYVANVSRISYVVTIVDGVTGKEIGTVDVLHGDDAEMPKVLPKHDGYVFSEFDDDGKNVTENKVVKAEYERIVCTVEIVDGISGEVMQEVRVPWGEEIALPDAVEHDGYEFDKWDHDGKVIKEDLRITSVYKKAEQAVAPPADDSGVADELVDTSNVQEQVLVEEPRGEIVQTGVVASCLAIAGIVIAGAGIIAIRVRRRGAR